MRKLKGLILKGSVGEYSDEIRNRYNIYASCKYP